MGLIKAAVSAVAGTFSDMWKDYFVCDSMDSNTLMVRGSKKGGGIFDNGDVITNGSGIVVADGQCALIVDEGLVLEVAAEPGNYTFDTSKSPSVFDNGWQGLKDTFNEMVSRFTYEGASGKNQRVYYVNTKEIMDNMFGTPTPVPFRVIDKNANLDLDISIRCNGQYSFQIVNPLLFYKNVAGNKAARFDKSELEGQMKSELLSVLQPSLYNISNAGIRYSEIPAHTAELVDALNANLSEKWGDLRGIKIVSMALNSVSASKDDEELIKNAQRSAMNKDNAMANATIVTAMADAMRDAANNPNGAAGAFMGVNMAQQTGMNAAAFTSSAATKYCTQCGKQVPADALFCPYCGKQLQ